MVNLPEVFILVDDLHLLRLLLNTACNKIGLERFTHLGGRLLGVRGHLSRVHAALTVTFRPFTPSCASISLRAPLKPRIATTDTKQIYANHRPLYPHRYTKTTLEA